MIRLLGSDPEWMELLRQEGVSFCPDDAGVDIADSRASVVVIDRDPFPSERESLRRFVSRGRGVLSSARLAARIWPDDACCRPTRIRYLLPDKTDLFRDVGVTHLDTDGCLSTRANSGFSDRGRQALYAGKLGDGWAVLLPFEISTVLADRRSAPRAFYASAPRQVTENVSRVNRGEVRRIVANSLNYLLAQQGLCYVANSCVPTGKIGLFGFRIDTDFDTPASHPAVVSLSGRTHVPFTWFLNVEACESTLGDVVRVLAGQDLQLHCYRHVVHTDYDSNRLELVTGKDLLAAHGIVTVGAAGPFGDWTPAWAEALADSGFEYSSEFTLAYDDTPFRAVHDGSPSQVLQVPVHPVCLGRLRAAGATPRQILSYYRRIAERQALRHEPCFLYGHPGNLAAEHEWMAKLLDEAITICGGASTLTDYAAWWRERERIEYHVFQDAEFLTLEVTRPNRDFGIRVVRGDRETIVPAMSGRFRFAKMQWRERTRYVPTGSEVAGGSRLRRLSALREWRRRRQRQTTKDGERS